MIGGLPRTSPLQSSGALAVNEDGRIVLGGTGNAGLFRPWLWMSKLGGAISLDDFLRAQGTYLSINATLNAPFSVSDDGTKFVGLGVSPLPSGRFGYRVDMSKVMVCHAPPGNPGNVKSISVGFPDEMLSHLEHGDTIGLCPDPQ